MKSDRISDDPYVCLFDGEITKRHALNIMDAIETVAADHLAVEFSPYWQEKGSQAEIGLTLYNVGDDELSDGLGIMGTVEVLYSLARCQIERDLRAAVADLYTKLAEHRDHLRHALTTTV